jgi:hypothetical protein
MSSLGLDQTRRLGSCISKLNGVVKHCSPSSEARYNHKLKNMATSSHCRPHRTNIAQDNVKTSPLDQSEAQGMTFRTAQGESNSEYSHWCRFDQEAFRGFDRRGNNRVDSQIDPDNRPEIATARRQQDTTVAKSAKTA